MVITLACGAGNTGSIPVSHPRANFSKITVDNNLCKFLLQIKQSPCWFVAVGFFNYKKYAILKAV